MEHIETTIYLPVNQQVRNKLLQERKIFMWQVVEEHRTKEMVEQIRYLDAMSADPIHM